ncbi:MAG: ATP-binding cassette domain-containing protein [Microscillaceae bacterium]|nr:ATP-binding cassette domain-containing protein [Microscillaceae bacterium]
MLKIEKLSYQYQQTKVLQIDHWEVAPGQSWLVLGASGSGKTTLLHLIAGILKMQEGQLWWQNTDLARLSESARDRLRAKSIGLVFQKPHLLPSLSVLKNLRLAQTLARRKGKRQACLDLLEKLGLSEKMHALPHQLSQGQAQRAAIARALVHQPALLLADEPTASLDDANAEKVVHLLQDLSQAQGTSLVIATHDQRVKTHFLNVLKLD